MSISPSAGLWLQGFDVDVLAGFDPGDGHGRMPVVRGRDGDSVDVLRGQNLAEVFLGDGLGPIEASAWRRIFRG
jgi:hypothetical protein